MAISTDHITETLSASRLERKKSSLAVYLQWSDESFATLESTALEVVSNTIKAIINEDPKHFDLKVEDKTTKRETTIGEKTLALLNRLNAKFSTTSQHLEQFQTVRNHLNKNFGPKSEVTEDQGFVLVPRSDPKKKETSSSTPVSTETKRSKEEEEKQLLEDSLAQEILNSEITDPDEEAYYFQQLIKIKEELCTSIEQGQNAFSEHQFAKEENITNRYQKIEKAIDYILNHNSPAIKDEKAKAHYIQLLEQTHKALTDSRTAGNEYFINHKFSQVINRENRLQEIATAKTAVPGLEIKDEDAKAYYLQLLEENYNELHTSMERAKTRFSAKKFDDEEVIANRLENIKTAIIEVEKGDITDIDETKHYIQLLVKEESALIASMKTAQSAFDTLDFHTEPHIATRFKQINVAISQILDLTNMDVNQKTHYAQLLADAFKALDASIQQAQSAFDALDFHTEPHIAKRFDQIKAAIAHISDLTNMSVNQKAHYTQLLEQKQNELSHAINEAQKTFNSHLFNNEDDILKRFGNLAAAINAVPSLDTDERKHYVQLLTQEHDKLATAIEEGQKLFANQYFFQKINLNECLKSIQATIEVEKIKSNNNKPTDPKQAYYMQLLISSHNELNRAMETAISVFNAHNFDGIENIAERLKKIKEAIHPKPSEDQNNNNAQKNDDQPDEIYMQKHYNFLLKEAHDKLTDSMKKAEALVLKLDISLKAIENIAELFLKFKNHDVPQMTDVNQKAHYTQLLEQKQKRLDDSMQRAQKTFNQHHFSAEKHIETRFAKIKSAIENISSLDIKDPLEKLHYTQLLTQTHDKLSIAIQRVQARIKALNFDGQSIILERSKNIESKLDPMIKKREEEEKRHLEAEQAKVAAEQEPLRQEEIQRQEQALRQPQEQERLRLEQAEIQRQEQARIETQRQLAEQLAAQQRVTELLAQQTLEAQRQAQQQIVAAREAQLAAERRLHNGFTAAEVHAAARRDGLGN